MVKKHLVRRLRHQHRLTQKELGLVIGQGQPYVSDIERGVRPIIAVKTLEKLALAFGVAMEELITADERRARAAGRQRGDPESSSGQAAETPRGVAVTRHGA